MEVAGQMTTKVLSAEEFLTLKDQLAAQWTDYDPCIDMGLLERALNELERLRNEKGE